MTIHAPLRMSGGIRKGSFIAKTRIEYARETGWINAANDYTNYYTKAAWFYDTASIGSGTTNGWSGDSGNGYHFSTSFDPPTSTPQRPFFVSNAGVMIPLWYLSVIHTNSHKTNSGSSTSYGAQLRTTTSGMSSITMKISKLDGSSPYTLTFYPAAANDYWIAGKSNCYVANVSSSFFNFFFNNRELLYQQL